MFERKHPDFKTPFEWTAPVEHIPADLYHSFEAVSASRLKHMLRSPAHYLHERNNPSEPTKAQRFGTLFHKALLEPADFRRHLVVQPKLDRRTKAGKADYEEWLVSLDAESILVEEEDAERIALMIDRVMAHDSAASLLTEGRAELSYFWRDDGGTDLVCKARADYLAQRMIMDIKTTTDASLGSFARDVWKYGWDIQCAHYLAGYKRLFLEEAAFTWIACETEPPYEVATHAANLATIDVGQRRREILMGRLARCIAEDRFPGYSKKIQSLALPQYCFDEVERMREEAA